MTSELQHGPVPPGLWDHISACLQDKVAVDELPDAGDGECDLRVEDGEVLVQVDAHGLEPRDNPLEVHPSLVHHQLTYMDHRGRDPS